MISSSVLICIFLFQSCNLIASKSILDQIVTGNNEMALKVYHGLLDYYSKDSIVFSPIGITISLAMISLGANPKTVDEIKNAYGISGGSNDEILAVMTNLYEMMSAWQDKTNFYVTNHIYLRKELNISLAFKDSMNKYFKNEYDVVDVKNSDETIKKINTWVLQQTHNLSNFLMPDQYQPWDSLLISGVYFNTTFRDEFSVFETRNSQFTSIDGNVKTVAMMYQTKTFNYANDKSLRCSILELPLASSSELSMYFILPDKPNGLFNLESRLSYGKLRLLFNALNPQIIEVGLPKINTFSQFQLPIFLYKVGIPSLFKSDSLSCIAPNVTLEMFLHDVKIIFDDRNRSIASKFTKSTTSVKFVVNRPMLFVVMDKITKAILLIGRFTGV